MILNVLLAALLVTLVTCQINVDSSNLVSLNVAPAVKDENPVQNKAFEELKFAMQQMVCSQPPYIPQYHVLGNHVYDNVTATATAAVSCRAAFTFVGDYKEFVKELTCGPDGWSQDLPECEMPGITHNDTLNVFAYTKNTKGMCKSSDAVDQNYAAVTHCTDYIDVVKFSSGASHSCALQRSLRDGVVFCRGDNIYGAVNPATPASGSIELDFRSIDSTSFKVERENIIDLQCGYKGSFVVTDQGNAYGWGANERGQLGQGNFDAYLKPVKLPTYGRLIRAVGAAFYSVTAVYDDGTIGVFGDFKQNTHYNIRDYNLGLSAGDTFVTRSHSGTTYKNIVYGYTGKLFMRNPYVTEVDYMIDITPAGHQVVEVYATHNGLYAVVTDGSVFYATNKYIPGGILESFSLPMKPYPMSHSILEGCTRVTGGSYSHVYLANCPDGFLKAFIEVNGGFDNWGAMPVGLDIDRIVYTGNALGACRA